MADIYRKKLVFETEIRKKHLQDKFKEMREDVSVGREVSESWAKFMKYQPPVVPAICLTYDKYPTDEMLKPFLTLIMNNELELIRTDRALSTWFFDCTAEVNLKFMTKICNKIDNCCLLTGFFNATVQSSRPFSVLFDTGSKNYQFCFLNMLADQGDEGKKKTLIAYLKSKEGSRTITVLLGFWQTYIQTTEESILAENFGIMLKSFHIFSQQAEIYHEKDTYNFIQKICRTIIKLGIFKQDNPSHMLKKFQVIENLIFFAENIKKKIPYMLKVNVEYNLFYPDLALILLAFSKINEHRPGLFIETLYISQFFKSYIFGLLRKEDDCYYSKYTALRLINKLNQFSLMKAILHLEGVINITRILAHSLLLDPLYQKVTVIILYNMVSDDQDQDLKSIFQLVDYKNLLLGLVCSQDEDNTLNILDFLVKVMSTYAENSFLYKIILEDCQLEVIMRQFYIKREDQQGYGLLAGLVLSNLQFFMKNHQGFVADMWHHADEMAYEGQEEWMKKVQEFGAIKLSNGTI